VLAQGVFVEAADAIDAHLMSGGLPGILRAWPEGTTALAFAEGECDDPASPLFGVPETALLAEFPGPDMTRRVIEAIGQAQAGSYAGLRLWYHQHQTVTPAGDDGMPFPQAAQLAAQASAARPTKLATGRAGDVFLCHPFLVHAASWPHTGRYPRIMAQPGVALHDAFPLVPPLSPVELAMTAAPGATRCPRTPGATTCGSAASAS
jgi:hypothetical protein